MCSDTVDEGEKGKLALNHFCRQAILQRRNEKKNYFGNFNLRQHVATTMNVDGSRWEGRIDEVKANGWEVKKLRNADGVPSMYHLSLLLYYAERQRREKSYPITSICWNVPFKTPSYYTARVNFAKSDRDYPVASYQCMWIDLRLLRHLSNWLHAACFTNGSHLRSTCSCDRPRIFWLNFYAAVRTLCEWVYHHIHVLMFQKKIDIEHVYNISSNRHYYWNRYYAIIYWIECKLFSI